MAIVCLHQDNAGKSEIYVNLDHVVVMERGQSSTYLRFVTSADATFKGISVIETPVGILELAAAGRPRY